MAGRFFHALGNVGVNVRAILQGASARSVSCAEDAEDAEDTAVAVRTVHSAFNLNETEIKVLLVGKGTVGGRLLTQLAENAKTLKARHGVALRLVGVVDSRRALFVDADVSAQVSRYRAAGKSLRYLAQIIPNAPGGPRVKVGPVAVDAAHPATGLKGAEAMVSFFTERYREFPLIVRGAGAGGDVTAAGVRRSSSVPSSWARTSSCTVPPSTWGDTTTCWRAWW